MVDIANFMSIFIVHVKASKSLTNESEEHISIQSIEFQNDLTHRGTENRTFLTQVNEITAILFYSICNDCQ